MSFSASLALGFTQTTETNQAIAMNLEHRNRSRNSAITMGTIGIQENEAGLVLDLLSDR
jgi:hypothetical protein